MQYLITGIDTHLDFGFGVTGDAYFKTAEHIYKSLEVIKFLQQKEMPVNYLYRHSIELFLKSLIIIFHKKLKLSYGTEPSSSKTPKILLKGKWEDLYKCHWLDELYFYWLNELLLKNSAKLKELAPKADWREPGVVSELIPFVSIYDRDSSFFRYPVTKNSSLDSQKNTMQKFNPEKINELLNGGEKDKKKFIMLLKNESGEVVEAFVRQEKVLDSVTQALKTISTCLCGIHAMTRFELCQGH